MVITLICQHGAFQLLCRDGLDSKVLGQHFAGAGVTFAAAGSDTEVATQFGHRGETQVYGLTDFTIRYVQTHTIIDSPSG